MPEAVPIGETKRLRLLELDEKRFGLEAIPSELSKRVDHRALAFQLELASISASFGCGKVPLKCRAVHGAGAACIAPRGGFTAQQPGAKRPAGPAALPRRDCAVPGSEAGGTRSRAARTSRRLVTQQR